MSATQIETDPSTSLSHGLAIEYRAFARPFSTEGDAAVLYLMATCYYQTNGFTIFFEEDGGKFHLRERPPTGIFLNLATYYVASWPADGVSSQADTVPPHVTIVDAQTEHRVRVRPWD